MNALLIPQHLRNVLITDSDPENRAYLREEFESQNFMVLEAEDAQETLNVLSTHQVGAVILDLELSKQQRDSLMAEILSGRYGNPLVFLMVSPSVLTREEAYALGAAGVLSKPIAPENLIARVRDTLVPAPIRWKREAGSERKRHTLEASVFKLQLGRGGFALAAEKELIEGEVVEFALEIKDSDHWTLHGTGIVRYVNLHTGRRGRALGIEFESLDDSSLVRFMDSTTSSLPPTYIPRLA